jgi:hypothetical protein
MSRDPRDPAPRADERRRAEVRAMLESAESAGGRGPAGGGPGGSGEEIDEISARRLEQELAADPALARELLEDPELDRLLRGERVSSPSDLDWARMDAAIGAATGIPLGRAASAAGVARTGLRRARWLVPIAAGLLLGVFVVREAFIGGLAPAAEATIVEVDLPDDRSYLILAGEAESDGVMIFISTS